MTTINGIGPRFVGSRDYDQETGSYVTTQAFCLIFIPFFALGAYRVMSNGANGWRILGKEPISRFARAMNYVMLGLIALGCGGGWWHTHTTSAEYLAQQLLGKASSELTAGHPASALELYGNVLTKYSPHQQQEAISGYSASFDEALPTLPLEGQQGLIRSVRVSRNLKPAPITNLAERVLKYSQKTGPADPLRASILLKEAMPTVQESEMASYRTVWRGFLEKAVVQAPQDPDLAIDLAVILEAEDKPDEARKLLEPHATELGTTEGARVLGQIMVKSGEFSQGAPLLQSYASAHLKELHQAEKKIEAVGKRVQDAAIRDLDENRGPPGFMGKYTAASESAKREMVTEFVQQRLKTSSAYAEAVSELENVSKVIPVMLSLGIAQLNLAQANPDPDARKKGLETAEKSFLAIRESAGGTDEYRLFLGQVYYWLGRHDDGRALFDQLLTGNGKSFEKQIMVANVLRQVGAMGESRTLAETAFSGAVSTLEKEQAAGFRALMFKDNEDRIRWLESAGQGKETLISLDEARASKKVTEGDRPGAEALLRKALAGYDALPRSATILNNSANVLSSLHQLTRDPAFFRDAINRHEEAYRMDGQNTVLLTNLISDWLGLLSIEAIASKIDLKLLPGGSASTAMALNHRSGAEQKQQMAELQATETFRKARVGCDQLIVLAPKNAENYGLSQHLAMLVEDLATLKSLRQKAAAAGLANGEQWTEAIRYWKGLKDAEQIKSMTTALAEWRETIKSLPNNAPPLLRQVCQYTLLNLQSGQLRLEMPVDLKAYVKEATALAKELPSYANLRQAQEAQLYALLDDLAQQDPKMADWLKRYQRHLEARHILILALETKLLGPQIKANEHFQAWLGLRNQVLSTYPGHAAAVNWALLKQVDPELANEEFKLASQDELTLTDIELDWMLQPTSPSYVLAMAWQEEMLGHPDKASTIRKEAIANGMPLPK